MGAIDDNVLEMNEEQAAAKGIDKKHYQRMTQRSN